MTKRSAVKFLPRTAVFMTALISMSTAIIIQDTRASGSNGNLPAVEVNLKAIAGSASASATDSENRTSKRIVDGREVIILTPPSLQEKTAPEKIAVPRKRPQEADLTVEMPKVAAVKTEKIVAAALPENVEKPPLDEEKLAAVDVPEKIEPPVLAEEKTPPPAAPKVDAIIEPATDKETPLPSAEEAAAAEKEVAEAAADKVSETEEEIKVAAVDPQTQSDAASEETKAAESLDEGELLSLQYSAGEVDLPEAAGPKIQSLYEQLESDPRTLQLIAYATANNNSAARRLSLGRALAVRSRLLELGMDNKRIEVRALGMPDGETSSDRVDLVLIAR